MYLFISAPNRHSLVEVNCNSSLCSYYLSVSNRIGNLISIATCVLAVIKDYLLVFSPYLLVALYYLWVIVLLDFISNYYLFILALMKLPGDVLLDVDLFYT